MRRMFIVVLVVMFAGGWMIPEISRAETFRLTIGAGHPVPASSWVAPMQTFLQVEAKKRVEQKTGHKIEWVEAYGGSVAIRIGSTPLNRRWTWSTKVESPHISRCFPRIQRSPGTVAGLLGKSGTESGSVRPSI